jgi:hypothetical protein
MTMMDPPRQVGPIALASPDRLRKRAVTLIEQRYKLPGR